MLNRINSTVKLYLLVLVLGTVIVGIGAYGISKMGSMNRNTQTMYADRVLPLQQLSSIRYAYAQSILSTVEELKNNGVTVAQAEQRIQEAEKSIAENWKAYQRTYLTPEEVDLIKQVTLLKAEADKIIDKLKQNLKKSNSAAFKNVADQSMYIAINPVINKITELIQLQVKVSSELNQSNNESYRSAKNTFWVLIAASLLFAVVLSFIILKDVWSLIKSLRESNKIIAESEQKYRTLIENAADAVLMINDETNIIDVNYYGCRLLGYTREELLKMKISQIVPQEELEKQGSYLKLIRKNKQALTERRLKRKDGSEVDVEINSQILEGRGLIAIIRDITERKKAELAIKESEAKYRYLFNNSPAFVIIWDLESLQVKEVSDNVVAHYGYTKEEWIDMSVLKYRPKEDHEKIKAFAKNMLIDGNEPVAHMAWRHIKKNGEEMQMEITSHKISYNGRLCILSLGTDVTERLKAEEEKRKSEQNYSSLFEQASDVILLTDLQGNILEVNNSGCELFGYTREEMIGKNVSVFMEPQQLRNEPITIPQLMEGAHVIRRRKVVKRNGEVFELESNTKRIFGDRILVIARDITELRKAELQIEASEERHRALTENISDAIMLIDENFENVYQSPSVERITGYTFEDGKDKKLFEFIHPDDLTIVVEIFNQVSGLPGVPLQSQFRVQNKKGHYIWIEGTIMNLLGNDSVRAFIVNYRDITERKKAEEKINDLNESLEQKVVDRTSQLLEANKALEAFSYSVTHDLRAPLRSVIGFTNIIQQEYAPSFNNDLKELFGFIGNSTKRMNAIIDDLLALAKYEKATLQSTQVDMEQLMKRVWGSLQFSSPHHATLQIEPLPVALGDESLLEQVVVNLLSNAVKYSSKKENPVIAINSEKTDGVVTYRVKDNGAGFDMKNYDRLFGAFQRLHGMSEFEGTGVGLLLVKRIIERHGGVVWADSKVDEGATFYFTLPSSN